MTIHETLLWNKILKFPLDDFSSAFSFTTRLARDNNWDLFFAQRVTDEYKKFIFLCSISSKPVTPSDAVDQAWHQHMIYTQSYWDDLCKNILGKPLHHNPTKGGSHEYEKFHNQYEGTLALYKEKFKEEPPADIWPPADKRFADVDFIRVNKRTHWTVRKPNWTRIAAGLLLIAGLLISIFTGKYAFLILAGIIFIAIMIAVEVRTGKHPGEYGSGCGSGCSHDNGCAGDSGCGSGCGGGGD